MKVIDNFLPQAYQDVLENTLLTGGFPWYFYQTTLGNDYIPIDIPGIQETYHFAHSAMADRVTNSKYFDLFQPIMYHLMLKEGVDTSDLLRIKANLSLRSNHIKNTFTPPHTDYANVPPFITCIYYVNDSDGDTLFFDEKNKLTNRVSPKKGRLVYFKGDTYHAKEAPQNFDTRCVINFNFELKESK
jgi:hypothetical protein